MVNTVVMPINQQVAHVLTDMSGIILSVDDNFCDVLGRPRSEIIGRGAIGFTAPLEQPAHAAALSLLRQAEKPLVVRKSYIRPDRVLVKVQNSAAVMSDGIGPKRLVATVMVLPEDFPMSFLEKNLSTAQTLAKEARARIDLLGKNDFSTIRWSLIIACYILECQGQSTLVRDLCEHSCVGESVGSLEILQLVSKRHMMMERSGFGLGDSSVRLSIRTNDLLTGHLSYFADFDQVSHL